VILTNKETEGDPWLGAFRFLVMPANLVPGRVAGPYVLFRFYA
jgi:hypothetical protein